MSDITAKYIVLNQNEIRLAYVMVRVSEVKQRTVHNLHGAVSQKLHIASHNLRGGEALITLSEPERELLRSYNTTYCANLADALLRRETNEAMSAGEVLYIYRMATRIQNLLSSRN